MNLQAIRPLGTGMGVIIHGSNAAAARPLGFVGVIWIGTVQPDNMAEFDIWEDISQ